MSRFSRIIFGMIAAELPTELELLGIKVVKFIEDCFMVPKDITMEIIPVEIKNLRSNLVQIIDSEGTLYFLMKEILLDQDAHADVLLKDEYTLGISKKIPKVGELYSFDEWIMTGRNPNYNFRAITTRFFYNKEIDVSHVSLLGKTDYGDVYEIKGNCTTYKREIVAIVHIIK